MHLDDTSIAASCTAPISATTISSPAATMSLPSSAIPAAAVPVTSPAVPVAPAPVALPAPTAVTASGVSALSARREMERRLGAVAGGEQLVWRRADVRGAGASRGQ